MLKNRMENLVAECLSQILEEGREEYAQICRCPVCVAQMQVNALNRLTPIYAEEDEDTFSHALSDQNEEIRAKLLVAVTQAIEQVGRTAHKNSGKLGAKDMQSLTGLHKRRDKP